MNKVKLLFLGVATLSFITYWSYLIYWDRTSVIIFDESLKWKIPLYNTLNPLSFFIYGATVILGAYLVIRGEKDDEY